MSMQAPEVSAEVRAVFVGGSRVIGEVRGRPVRSGIAKARVDAAALGLSRVNLTGDRQADLSVHGGRDKAVYVYPSEHYPAWRDDGFALDIGSVGENVALAGTTEHDVRVGDVWRWGGALVQVSQPRAPCYKLSLHTGHTGIGRRLIATRRSGWYLRVLAPGMVPTAGGFELIERHAAAPTVHDTFAVMFDGEAADDDRGRDVLGRVLASPALAEAWRTPLVARRGEARR